MNISTGRILPVPEASPVIIWCVEPLSSSRHIVLLKSIYRFIQIRIINLFKKNIGALTFEPVSHNRKLLLSKVCKTAKQNGKNINRNINHSKTTAVGRLFLTFGWFSSSSPYCIQIGWLTSVICLQIWKFTKFSMKAYVINALKYCLENVRIYKILVQVLVYLY